MPASDTVGDTMCPVCGQWNCAFHTFPCQIPQVDRNLEIQQIKKELEEVKQMLKQLLEEKSK